MTEPQTVKVRSRLSVLVLTLASLSFVPGIGQLFAGRLKRAVIFYLASVLTNVVFITSGALNHLYGFGIFLLIQIIVAFYIAYDAFKLNADKNGIELKWFNKWYFYSVFIILCLAINYQASITHYYKTWSIPMENSAPTLQIGDRLVATANTQTQYATGSLVLFNPPDHSKNMVFIKRIVAQNGDRFQIKNGVAYLNNKQVNEPYVLAANNKKPESINFGPVKVPAGFVLVLGDNRDNSIDSRKFGYVPTTDIIGKALFLYWAHDSNRIGLRLDK